MNRWEWYIVMKLYLGDCRPFMAISGSNVHGGELKVVTLGASTFITCRGYL